MPETPDNQGSQQGFQPVPSQPAAPPMQHMGAPAYQPVAAPPPKQGTSALKIVLIIVAIFVGIGLIGAGIIGYGVYKVAKAVKMSTNSSQPVTESELGVALYPGAEQSKGSFRMNIAGKSMVTGSYLTSDSKDLVEAFYQNSLGSNARTSMNANGETFMLNKGSGESVTVTVVQNPALNEGKTQIVIVHAANTASQ